MSLTLIEEKMEKVIFKCQNFLSLPQTTLLELTKSIGLMSSTVQAFLSARLQLRYLHQQQIQYLNQAGLYQTKEVLNTFSKQELI